MCKDEKTNEDKQEERKVAKRASLAIFLLVLVLFAGLMCITYFVEVQLGKTAGTIALVIMAVIIAIYLYRKEILDKIRRYKNDSDKDA